MKRTVAKTAVSMLLAVALVAPMTQSVLASNSPYSRTPPVRDDSTGTTSRTPASSAASGSNFQTSSKYKYSTIKKRIATYQETNKDVKGWLTVPGTNINEPVLYSNKDNSYYLYRDWKGDNYPQITWTNFMNYPASAAYADFRTKFGDSWKKGSRNTVIYGHNWTNLRPPMDIGTNNSHIMFGQLPSYTDMDFAKKNPYIYYSTDENEGIWVVFAVAYSELKTSFNYNAPNPNKDNFDKLIKEWQKRSIYNFDVDVNSDDRILTLSTCTRMYNMGEYQRYVVVARLLRDGESENDAVKVTVNKDQKAPQF